MNSDAMKKVKEEKPEWTIKTTKRPMTIVVNHFGQVHILAEKEIRELMSGMIKLPEFVHRAELGGEKFELEPLVDLSRYEWLPKYMYRRFVRKLCDLLDIEYTPQMLLEMKFEPETPKATVEFREAMPWDKAEKRAVEIGKTVSSYKKEIDALENFFKMIKEREKKK